MPAFDAISGDAIASVGVADAGPAFDVTGLSAVTFGTPALPVLPHSVQSLRAVTFGTPAIPVDLEPAVTGLDAVTFGTPSILRYTAATARRIRIHLSGIRAARFGKPRI